MISPATGAPDIAGPAPEIAPDAIAGIFARIAPFSFEHGLDVAISASFEQHFEKVTFSLAYAGERQTDSDPEPFLEALRSAGDVIAERLSVARAKARANGTVSTVGLEGLILDASWPAVAIIAEPYTPEDEDEYLDEEFLDD